MKIEKHSDFTYEEREEKFGEVLKEFNAEIKSEPLEYQDDFNVESNIYGNPISTNDTENSNIWGNFHYKKEIECKKEEIKEQNYDIKHDIKSECKVDLKTLNIKVKTEDCKEAVYLTNDFEHVQVIQKSEFFTSDKKFNTEERKTQINEETQSKQYDIEYNPRRAEHYKINSKKFAPSVKTHNRWIAKIKKKYLKMMHASYSKSTYTCGLCKQTFLKKAIFHAHLFFHIGKKPFRCTSCNRMCSWKFLLQRHIKLHNNEDQIKVNNRIIQDHFSGEHVETCSTRASKQGTAYVCTICGKECNGKRQLTRHKARHIKDRPFKCNMCCKKFTKKCHLSRHKENHSNKCKYSCRICKRRFKRKDCWRKHEITHNDKNMYFCDLCEESFKCESSLAKHRFVEHENMFVCWWCRRAFKTKDLLKEHSKTHVQKCNICKKKFSCKSTLAIHKRIHADVKPFSCEVCKRSFRTKSHLKRHGTVHNEASFPFYCDVCKKGYNLKSDLLKHVPIHLKNPYFCSHCKKAFKTEIELKCHLKVFCLKVHPKHPKGTPYQCNICDQIFKKKVEFEKHLITYDNKIHFYCDVCERNFTTQLEFQTHQETSHTT
ncbi:zinc finger protein 761-like [Centruroides vittatus]|uniref:zinc finger protein 761-like n=1 Tax=Centruroides vittatus TaxID=120091 RepID=UPI003510CE76